MRLQEYTRLAIKTESQTANIIVDLERLKEVLTCVTAAGNLLDVAKKDIFYGVPADIEKQQQRINRLCVNELALIKSAPYFVTTPVNDSDIVKTKISHINPRVLHAIIGVATESVELLEALTKSIDANQSLDEVNLLEEAGDICWYLAILHDALAASWEYNLERNIKKLQQRYPNKFNDEQAHNRDIDAERSILEDKDDKEENDIMPNKFTGEAILGKINAEDNQIRFTTDEIIKIVSEANLGTLSNGNTVSGSLSVWMNGVSQALYNIVHDVNATQRGINNILDSSNDDMWEQGYNATISQYILLMKQLNSHTK